MFYNFNYNWCLINRPIIPKRMRNLGSASLKLIGLMYHTIISTKVKDNLGKLNYDLERCLKYGRVIKIVKLKFVL